MITLKPDFYDEFVCIADKCNLSCCNDWQIYVDDKTYDKYQKIEGKLGDKLRNNIIDIKIPNSDKKSKCIKLKKDGRCPMLNEKGLCEIVLEKGSEYLSIVCTKFPREENSFNNLKIKSFMLSCPAVVDFLYKKQIEISIEVDNKDEINSNKILNSLGFSIFNSIMIVLRIPELPLSVKQYLVSDLLAEITNPDLEGDFDRIQKFLSLFLNNNYIMDSAEKVQKNDVNPNEKFSYFSAIFKLIIASLSISKIPKLDILKDGSLTLDEFLKEEKLFNEQVFKDIEIVFENLCVYEIYRRLMLLKTSDLYEHYSIILFESMVIKFTLFAFWVANGHSISKDEQKLIISATSRIFVNKSNFAKDFYKENQNLEIFNEPIEMYKFLK